MFSELAEFLFNNHPPAGADKHLVFAIISFCFSLVIYVLNGILGKIKNVDYLKFQEYTLRSLFLRSIGSFLISFLLTTAQIINITTQSALLVGFSWDKLFSEMSKNNTRKNPNQPRRIK